MSHPQALRIPFQEFGFFTQLSQESSPQTSSHTHILEENLLISCKSHKKIVPLQPNTLGYRQKPISRDLEKIDFTESEDDMAKKNYSISRT